MAKEIQRSILIELNKWQKGNLRKPLLLLGARQVGKTRSLKSFGAQKYPRAHYFNFEEDRQIHSAFVGQNLNPYQILEKLSLVIQQKINPETDLIIFDEIQACGEALTSLKYFTEQFYENSKQLHLAASGSLLGIGLTEASFPVGKVELLEMYPISYLEFLHALGRDDVAEQLTEHPLEKPISPTVHQICWNLLLQYFVVGGLPEVVANYIQAVKDTHSDSPPATLEARKIQSFIVQAYQADIAKHAGKTNAMHIVRVLQAIPAQLMRAVDTAESTRRFTFKDVIPGIRGYSGLVNAIDWLTSARLVKRIAIANKAESPLNAFTKENIFKLYAHDIGVLGSLVSLHPSVLLQYQFGTYKGAIAEQFVAQELQASGINNLICWQEGQSEIEFLIEGSKGILPIEVKSAQRVQAKSLSVFEKRYNPAISVVLSAKTSGLETEHNRLYLPLYLAHRVKELL